jgi:hypothetical protein
LYFEEFVLNCIKIISNNIKNMKKFILGAAAIVTVAIFVACDNKKSVAEPVQDTEFQSTKDVTFANATAIELAQIAAYMGEAQLTYSYLLTAPGSSGAITTTVLSATHYQVTYSLNPMCRDGKRRNGTVDLYISSNPTNFNANAFRDPGFVGTMSLTNFSVDGWLINNVDPIGNPFKVYNTTAFTYSPQNTNLKWTITGKLTMEHPTDDAKDISWDGNFEQTLANTNNAFVFPPTKLVPIVWSSTNTANCAKLEYTGSSKGVTGASSAYTFSITEKPLVRDFSCSPDKVLGVIQTTAAPGLIPVYSEWHPFIGGIASMTTALAKEKEARKIDYSTDGANSCDNAGKVTIKGVDSPVDFPK